MELRGSHVLLRPFRWEDAPDLFPLCQDEEMTRFLAWGPHKSLEDTYRMLEGYIGQEHQWAVEVGGKAVGWIALLVDWQNQIAEIATWLGRPYWSSGVNREAKSLVLDYGFGSLNLQRIESITHVENIKAQRGLEKLGFVREGVLRRYRKVKGWHWDMVMYSLLPEEWWQRQGS